MLRRAFLVAALVVAGLSPLATQTAIAAPAPAADPAATHRVTLVTGDVVQVSEVGGKTSVAIDRAEGAVQAYTKHGDLYVVPERVAPYLRAGTVDAALFNVTKLIEQGRADEQSKELPLIVTYTGDRSRSALLATADALPASEPTLALPSIDGASLALEKSDAATFWSAVDGTAGKLDRGLEKIWLDGTVKVSLDVSVPLIGAPEAWAAGYDGTGTTVAVLDTGVDADHPDLAGRIEAQQDFTGGGDPVDHHGHGTHVAATVGGTGAASGGARKGVAPGAALLSGKVLNDGGSGLDSWIIAGMEWATSNGADVVSMSLGGYASDGTDPLSVAVNELTASTGTLFVIASGNYGPSQYSVTNPGTAEAALTVGNVTKTEEIFGSSGRGPRTGDHAIKPDITAPGTDIVAARAEGTSLGTPVDENYTSLTGTSMATPHVAGAAAIVKQQHPDWTPAQVKSALVSTAKPRDDLSVYDQGGGRVDVAKVTSQGVFAGPTPLNFGYLAYPQTELDPITKTVTLTNLTGADVALDLTASAGIVGGAPAPVGMVTVSQPSVTVPANGSASVDVTVDPALGVAGLYSGYFVGQAADGTRVSLPLGLNKEPESYDLNVTALDRFGQPNRGATIQIGNVDDSSTFLATPSPDANGRATVRVPPGTYSVVGVVTTIEGSKYTYTFVGEPEVEVGPGGASVVLDGRKAVPIRVDVGRETENVSGKLEWWRIPVRGASIDFRYLLGEPFADMYATPTKPVTKGGFHLVTQFSLVAPDIEISAKGLKEFQPEYFVYAPELDKGRYRYGVVDASKATPEDLARVDSRGKIVLIEAEGGLWSEQITAAAADGAKLALLYSRNGYPFFGSVERNLPIPGAALDVEEADVLLAWLKRGGRSVDVASEPDSPFLYDLRYDHDGAVVAGSLTHRVRDRDVATVRSTYRSDAARRDVSEVNAAFAPWQEFSFDANRYFRTPGERTEYVTARPGLLWLKTVYGYETADVVFGRPMRDQFRYYDGRNDSLRDTWFGAPGVPTPRNERTAQDRIAIPCAGCRDGDELFFWLEDLGDSSTGHYGAFDTRWENSAARLYRDGELVVSRRTGRGVLTTTPGVADYRLELDTFSDAPWSWGPRTKSAWTFRSGAPSANSALPAWYTCGIDRGRDCAYLPMLFASYDIPLDAQNRAPAGRTFRFDVSVAGQPFAPARKLARVDVDVSYDDGATWQRAYVRKSGGTYEVTVRHPSSAQFVSLRLRAEDSEGNGLTQELTRAYRLRAPGS